MPDDLLSTLVLTVAGVVGRALLYRQYSGRGSETPADGPIVLRGRGGETTRPFALAAGRYKLAYAFPDGVLTSVALLDTATGDSDTLLVAQGSGATSFEIGVPARYALHVAPADDSAAWSLTLSPLGLPSRR